MHRFIVGLDQPQQDHRDGDGLNNQRSNLRSATHSQNMANAIGHRNNTSGYKGVYWHEKNKCWRAQIICMGKRYLVYGCKTKEAAALAYNKKAVELFGEFARLNTIRSP